MEVTYISKTQPINNILIIIFSLLSVAFCIWSLDRGFEITDEAYYLLMAKHPESVTLYISAQQWITGSIWQITGTLTSFRAAGLLLLIISSGLLTFSAMRALSQSQFNLAPNSVGGFVALASSICCALLYAETINLSPCYNLLAACAAYAAAGLTLLALHASVKWKRYTLLILAGLTLSIELVNKPSSGIASLFLITLWIFLFNKSLTEKVIQTIAVVISIFLFTILLAISQTTIADAMSSFGSGMDLFRMVQVEPISVRLIRYIGEYTTHLIHALKVNFALIIIIGFYLWTRRNIFIIATYAFITYTLLTANYLSVSADTLVEQMQLSLVFFLSGLVVSVSAWKQNIRRISVIAGLAILPYTVAVGTGNSIFTQAIISLAPWGTALAIIAMLSFERKSDKIMITTLLMGFILTMALQIISSSFRVPYHMVRPLSEQTTQVLIKGVGTVKTDEETFKFVTDLNNAKSACDIVPGTPYLGLYNIPGVSLILETIPASTPWLNNLAQAEAVLEKLGPNADRSSIIAIRLNADGSTPSLPSILGPFPDNFKLCGTARYPFEDQQIQIWRSNVH